MARSIHQAALASCFLAAVVLFYFANRPAYRGYFSEDDLATLSWAPIAGADTYYGQILTPKLNELNFRSFATLYYALLGRTAGLHYAPYVAVLQALHLLNVILLIFLLRGFGFSMTAAGAGALFYAFNAAVMEVYWKPMFVFDLLCGTLCLAALLLYIHNHWILALIPYWLALKSKEIALLLPVALLAYEMLLGGRRWKRLPAFFLIALSFGLQAVWHNHTVPPGGTYSLDFTPEAALRAARYYSSALLRLPDLWVALLLLPFLLRDCRVWLGTILTVAVFVPVLFLPSRMLSVYWYVPLIGLAVTIAAIASRIPRWAIAAFAIIWLPLYFFQIRDMRRVILADGDASRGMVAALRDYKRKIPPVRAIVFDNFPERLGWWGVSGAIGVIFGQNVQPAYARNPDAKEAQAKVPMALISFHPPEGGIQGPLGIQGMIRTRDGFQSYARFGDKVDESQFGDGCYDQGLPLRWFAPRAQASFYRPRDAVQFEIAAFLSSESLASEGPSNVTLYEDGKSLGTIKVTEGRLQPLRWNLTPGSEGDKRITILCKPVRHGGPEDPRDFGILVKSLGYIP